MRHNGNSPHSTLQLLQPVSGPSGVSVLHYVGEGLGSGRESVAEVAPTVSLMSKKTATVKTVNLSLSL